MRPPAVVPSLTAVTLLVVVTYALVLAVIGVAFLAAHWAARGVNALRAQRTARRRLAAHRRAVRWRARILGTSHGPSYPRRGGDDAA